MTGVQTCALPIYLLVAALNDAHRKAEALSEETMGRLTAGMPGLPGGMKLPF